MEFYFYSGPVFSFGKLIAKDWYGETYAVSEKKAISNLTYQFKRSTGFNPDSKFELDSKYLKRGK